MSWMGRFQWSCVSPESHVWVQLVHGQRATAFLCKNVQTHASSEDHTEAIWKLLIKPISNKQTFMSSIWLARLVPYNCTAVSRPEQMHVCMLNSFHVPHCKVVLCRGKPFTYWPISNSTVSGRRFCLFHITGLVSVLGIQKQQFSREFSTYIQVSCLQVDRRIIQCFLSISDITLTVLKSISIVFLIPKPPLGLIRFHFTKTPMYNHLIHSSCKTHLTVPF